MGVLKDRKIKVAMYTPVFLPYYGGTEMATHYLTRELLPYCDVSIHTFNLVPPLNEYSKYGLYLSSRLPENEVVDGVRVVRYPFTDLPLVKSLSARLITGLITSNSDIVHFQGLHRLPSRFMLQKALKRKIKILTTHALHESIEILQKRKNRLFYPFFIESLRDVDHIIALSRTDQQVLLHLGVPANRITVIPNGINTDKFRKRRQFVKKNEKIKILCVARFARNKNYESLLYTLKNLKSHLNIEAYFIGNPDDHRYFEEIRSAIRMMGLESVIKIYSSLDDPALVDCYLSCDLFVLPSLMETFPLAILEAMYAGLPVVATPVGAIPELINPEVNGFLVSPNNPRELYEKCLLLLQNKRLMDEMGALNRETAKQYTWKKVAASTYALYKRLLKLD